MFPDDRPEFEDFLESYRPANRLIIVRNPWARLVSAYEDKIVDRQVGRNGDLFALSIGKMETREERYPYLRILVSIVEQAHPEWNQAPNKDQQVSMLIFRMSHGSIDRDEVGEIVQLRDAERGYTPIEKKGE